MLHGSERFMSECSHMQRKTKRRYGIVLCLLQQISAC